MKKLAIIVASAGLLLTAAPVLSVFAKNPKSPADHNGLHKGKSEVKHLYLYEKNPETWEVEEDGAWGKMTYDNDSFVFNGHGLESETAYTLLRYNDPWPGYPVVCLGDGMSNDGGNVHLSDEMLNGGPKVWLVLSDDVDCDSQEMVGWDPTEYLFEYDLIDVDGPLYIETVQVDADNDMTTHSVYDLDNGADYLLKVSGIADACDGCVNSINFDADYSSSYLGDEWTDYVTGYESEGDELLDLKVDGASVDWGGPNDDTHEYEYEMVGDGSPVELVIYDIYYPNNTGSLSVDVYKVY